MSKRRGKSVKSPLDAAALHAKVINVRTERFLADVRAEAARARLKFPNTSTVPGVTLGALVEEVGELAQALLEHQRTVGGNAKKPVTARQVYEEAVQVANMALIMATQGDAAFPYSMERIG